MALGAIYAIQDAGLTVPEDLAVVGYDNREFSRIFRPRITTVSMPVYEMGLAAAELLLKQIAEGCQNVDEIKIKGQIYIRETCGAVESQRTKEELLSATVVRRLLLNKHPEG
jgi:DNA-binding LacI/PurR family transcriptional regulator